MGKELFFHFFFHSISFGSVLTVYVTSTNNLTGTQYFGKLHLVLYLLLSPLLSCPTTNVCFYLQIDLAGSECVGKSEVVGDRLREVR